MKLIFWYIHIYFLHEMYAYSTNILLIQCHVLGDDSLIECSCWCQEAYLQKSSQEYWYVNWDIVEDRKDEYTVWFGFTAGKHLSESLAWEAWILCS